MCRLRGYPFVNKDLCCGKFSRNLVFLLFLHDFSANLAKSAPSTFANFSNCTAQITTNKVVVAKDNQLKPAQLMPKPGLASLNSSARQFLSCL